MKTRARGVRLPEELADEIEREQERTGQNFSETIAELVREAVRMRRAPGIVFRSGPTGRRASVAGTGVDVWEIVAAYRRCGEDRERLQDSFPDLDERQLRAALNYYELYPEAIERRLEREEELGPERVYGEHPFMRPEHRR